MKTHYVTSICWTPEAVHEVAQEKNSNPSNTVHPKKIKNHDFQIWLSRFTVSVRGTVDALLDHPCIWPEGGCLVFGMCEVSQGFYVLVDNLNVVLAVGQLLVDPFSKLLALLPVVWRR